MRKGRRLRIAGRVLVTMALLGVNFLGGRVLEGSLPHASKVGALA